MTADMAATVLNAAMHNDIDVLQRNLDGLDPDDDDVRSYKVGCCTQAAPPYNTATTWPA